MKAPPRALKFLCLPLVAAAVLISAGCGGGDNEKAAESSAGNANLAQIKDFLTSHTEELAEVSAEMAAKGKEYYELAEAADFDYEKLLSEKKSEVNGLLEESRLLWKKANPAYEEAEGVVAGVPSLASYDIDIDAGTDGDGEDPVSFDLELADGETLKRPGNLFFLTETSLFGTNPDFQAEEVKDQVEVGKGIPDADFYRAASEQFSKFASDLNDDAASWEPTESDVFSALVVMIPTMSEYFEAWKNSRFVAGDKATEQSFVGASRLADIAGILSGLNAVYDDVEPLIATEDAEQAQQTGEELSNLLDFAKELRDDEDGGKKFTAEEADSLGAEAQKNAEDIAGQISQSAAKLDIEIQE